MTARPDKLVVPVVDGHALAGSRLLTVGEVARTLGVSRRTVYRLAATGRIARARIGRRIVVPAAAIPPFRAERTARQSVEEQPTIDQIATRRRPEATNGRVG